MADLTSTIFAATAADLQRKIAPQGGTSVFGIGTGLDITEAQAIAYLNQAEQRVEARLRVPIAKLLRAVSGEVLIGRAAGGETEFTLGLTPIVTGTLKLYKNFEDRNFWRNRTADLAMAAGTFTVNQGLTKCTLTTALVYGDRLWAEYGHTAAQSWTGLKEIMLTIAAATLARDFEGFNRSAETLALFTDAEKGAFLELDNTKSIPGLPALKLVEAGPDPADYYQAVVSLGGSGSYDPLDPIRRWPNA